MALKSYNIQALRAFAAYSVVLHHIVNSINSYISRVDTDIFFFHAGVDVFFVISGFVMCAATFGRSTAPGQFLGARLARIVPIYWLLTCVGALALYLGLQLFGWTHFSLAQFLGSLAFIPMFDAHGQIIKPVLFVGWTLIFEMLFYLLFAISLHLKSEQAQKRALYAMIASIVLANLALDNPALNLLGSPWILEFAAGVLVWQITQRWVLPVRAAWGLLVLAVAAIMGSELLTLPPAYKYDLSCVVYGLPAALIVLAFVSLERGGVVFNNRFLQFQGDASYSLYLTHIFVFQAFGKAAIVTGFNQTAFGVATTVVAATIASCIVASLFHLRVERPLNALARSLRLPGRRVEQMA